MKLKKRFIVIPIVIAVLVFFGLYYYYNSEDNNSLTVTEKRWIQENVDTLVDIETVSDYPLYSGEDGLVQSFLTKVTKATGLEFNNVPYLKNNETASKGYRFRILNSDEKLGDNDLFVGEDPYVVVGREYHKINRVDEFDNLTLGVFSNDVAEISYYLRTSSNVTFKAYDDVDKLFASLDKQEVNMVVIPNTMYLDKTIGNKNYIINYTLSDMNKKIVFTLSDSNKRLNSIMTKIFNNWKTNDYLEKYNEVLLNYYVDANNISDKTKTDLLAKTYTYGYVENNPYEVRNKKSLSGISAAYIDRIERLTGIDFKYVKYDNFADLKKAIDAGKVDIYFNYYDYENKNYKLVTTPIVEEYVVVGKVADSYVINSFEGLKNKNVSMISNTALFNYFKENSKSNIIEFDSYRDMLKNSGSNLLIVDKEVYNAYRSSKFKKYEVLYSAIMTKDYGFMVKDSEEVFYNLFNYVINTNSYYRYRNNGLNSLNTNILQDTTFEQLYIIILAIIFVPLIILVLMYVLYKRKRTIKRVKKEERRKYTDMLTSLKNRNYLNLNIEAWNHSKKYPQAIVMIDLNNVKYVNDNYGHEAGDNLIVKAASMLVSTQLENSEIIRTDGNEFLIYLVGYSENQMETYTKKLTKEFKGLPYGFGAAIGYSMILDDIKTIDDAINEATLEMRTDKEDYK